ncbi:MULTISPECIES: hypothetical protein [unclassified Endozoicomonas]|uniref:hypothetical protein n=1 Tax=unclassified Endozoicomonas TaxID=2644528 RepID=UPI003BB5FA8A
MGFLDSLKAYIEYVLSISGKFHPVIAMIIEFLVVVLVILSLIYAIAYIFTTSPIQKIVQGLKCIFSVIAKSARNGINDPIKYPKLKKGLLYLEIFHSYITSVLMFVFVIAISYGYAISAAKINIYQHLTFIGFLTLFFYFSAFFKAQGGRGRVELREMNQSNDA